MIRTLLTLAITLSTCIRGCAQIDSVEHHNEKDMIQSFDIKKFNENQDGAGDYSFTTYDMSVRQYSMYDSGILMAYIEECQDLHTPYSYYYRYDIKGRLRQKSVSFSGFHVGKSYRYDQFGRVIETKDYSEPYKFKLKDLIEKMKKEYGCDLLNKERTYAVHRSEGERDLKRPWYSVYYLEDGSRTYGDKYLIDGTTGETLYILKHQPIYEWWDEKKYMHAYLNRLPMTIVEKYLYELKKKKGEEDKKDAKKAGKGFWRKLLE